MAVTKLTSQVNSNEAPIGIFDSGVGGLTVARTIVDQLGSENILYVGDTKYGPYGQLTREDIRKHAFRVADSLVAQGIKALVIACNTASAVCWEEAKTRYSIPVIEVIRPTVKRALVTTRSGKIGVIGTTATINSGSYQKLLQQQTINSVHAQACPGLVELVEKGLTSGPEVAKVVKDYLTPLLSKGIDTLVLGCTHYPFLSGVIQMVCGPEVVLVSSAEETTKELVATLTAKQMLRKPTKKTEVERKFIATGDDKVFYQLAARFLGPRI